MSAVCLYGCVLFVAYGCSLYVCCVVMSWCGVSRRRFVDGLCVHLVLWRVMECVSVPGLCQARGVCLALCPNSAVSERGHVFGDSMANHWCPKQWTLRRACTGLEDHRSVGRYQTPFTVADLRTRVRIHHHLGRFWESESSMTPECEPRQSLKCGRFWECLFWGSAQKGNQTEIQPGKETSKFVSPCPRNEAASHQNRSFGLYTNVSCRASSDT